MSFEPKVRDEFQHFMDAEETIAIQNCDMKRSKFGSGYEVVLSQKSSVISSPKRFKLDQVELTPRCDQQSLGKIIEINDIAANMGKKFTFQGKIVSAEKAIQTITTADRRSFVKWDYVVSDSSCACRLVMWEGLVDAVEIKKSYMICQVHIKAYNGEKYFSSTDRSEVKEIENIGEVANLKQTVGNEQFVGEVIGVVSCNKFVSCISCGGKIEDLQSSSYLGSCSKCGLKQKLSKCQTKSMAQVMIENEETKEKKTRGVARGGCTGGNCPPFLRQIQK